MVPMLLDHNMPKAVLRGLRKRGPDIDVVSAQEVGIDDWDDPRMLEWAATNNRAVISLDRRTLSNFAYERIERGEKVCGVFLVKHDDTVARVIDELEQIDACSDLHEWHDRVSFLPLRWG